MRVVAFPVKKTLKLKLGSIYAMAHAAIFDALAFSAQPSGAGPPWFSYSPSHTLSANRLGRTVL